MTREELIKKWLDHELNAEEQAAFERLDDFHELSRLDRNIKRFKAPEFHLEQSRNTVMAKIQQRRASSASSWKTYALRIAAVLVIGLSILWFFTGQDTTISTLVAEKTTISLPDESEVVMNAQSTLLYNSSKNGIPPSDIPTHFDILNVISFLSFLVIEK